MPITTRVYVSDRNKLNEFWRKHDGSESTYAKRVRGVNDKRREVNAKWKKIAIHNARVTLSEAKFLLFEALLGRVKDPSLEVTRLVPWVIECSERYEMLRKSDIEVQWIINWEEAGGYRGRLFTEQDY